MFSELVNVTSVSTKDRLDLCECHIFYYKGLLTEGIESYAGEIQWHILYL